MSFLFRNCIKKLVSVNISKNQTCSYARWNHRRPMNVYPPEKFEDFDKKNDIDEETFKDEYNKVKWKHQKPIMNKIEFDMEEIDERTSNITKPKKIMKPKINLKTSDMLETVIDSEGQFVYTKMANNDPRVGSLLTTLKSKKDKIKKDLILLEGKRLINEALLTGCKLKYLLFTRKDELEFLKPLIPKIGAQLYKMPYKEMQMWSDLTTCPGIMGVFKTPEADKFITPKNALPLTIICDNIREPGNLGAILRAAAGVGCKQLFLTKGCVNIWDTKVTRSAAGAHFRVQMHNKTDFNEIRSKLGLNVKMFIADNKIVSESGNLNENEAELVDIAKNMPILPYYSIQFNKTDEIVLIIGGETKGISLDSYKLANEFNGVRLNIPLNNGVESLNTGMALGIISFEIKRQMALSLKTTKIVFNEKIDKEMDVSLGLRGI